LVHHPSCAWFMGTASLKIKGWNLSFDLSKPQSAQSENQILKLGCVRTRASKETGARVGSAARGPLASNVLSNIKKRKDSNRSYCLWHFLKRLKVTCLLGTALTYNYILYILALPFQVGLISALIVDILRLRLSLRLFISLLPSRVSVSCESSPSCCLAAFWASLFFQASQSTRLNLLILISLTTREGKLSRSCSWQFEFWTDGT
jgi:hypothetical protein